MMGVTVLNLTQDERDMILDALRRIPDEAHWDRYDRAKTASDNVCFIDNPMAYKFSTLGAIARAWLSVNESTDRVMAIHKAQKLLSKICVGQDLARISDEIGLDGVHRILRQTLGEVVAA